MSIFKAILLSILFTSSLFQNGCGAQVPPPVAPIPRPQHYVVTIRLKGSLENGTSKGIIAQIQAANDAKADQIVFEINSDGGWVSEGEAIAKEIEKSHVPVHCVVSGEAQSMAYYILQSCPVRSMTKDSFLMVHNPYRIGYMRVGIDKETFDMIADLRATVKAHLRHNSKRTNVSIKAFRKKIANAYEWIVKWEEAARIRMVDSVVESLDATIKSYQKWMTPPPNLARRCGITPLPIHPPKHVPCGHNSNRTSCPIHLKRIHIHRLDK